MSGSWTIVGIDCATQEERTGLARGTLDADGKVRVERVTLGTAGESAAASVCEWIRGKPRFVLAMGAPLGWPAELAAALSKHKAGAPISAAADQLFRRRTDRTVQKVLGRTPAEVGADRVARTAHAALGLLAQIRARAGHEVPLVWKQSAESGVIEVNSGVTLVTRGLPSSGYKSGTAACRKARGEVLKRLSAELDVAVTHDLLLEDANLLDAMICVLAGADFARGLCVEPEDLRAAKKEGFIWFRGTGQRALRY
ncbi:MAG TPA: DUF429 domain-containing protein [Polyangiales bacterium]